MKATVALEARYLVTPDGRAWTRTGMGRRFWESYLLAFDKVRILARGVPVAEAPEGWFEVTGPNIEISPIPDYCGPLQFVRRNRRIRAAVERARTLNGSVILRSPGQVGTLLLRSRWRTGRPYGVEVVGDPWEVFAPGAVRHPLRPVFRLFFSHGLREQCRRASAVAYVAQTTLQARYPASKRAFVTHYSSVELPEKAFLSSPRRFDEAPNGRRLLFVGSLAQLYKGQDVLLEAIGRCAQAGLDVWLRIAGDGRYREYLTGLAERRGVAGRVEFFGEVAAGEGVRRVLDEADLFVLPSRTEGLPRAMVEAMARGLPCIGTNVGGIPELLEPDDLVPAGDAKALASKIQEVLRDPRRMEAMSRRNLEKAREYREEVLAPRRKEFYEYVRTVTAEWERRQGQ